MPLNHLKRTRHIGWLQQTFACSWRPGILCFTPCVTDELAVYPDIGRGDAERGVQTRWRGERVSVFQGGFGVQVSYVQVSSASLGCGFPLWIRQSSRMPHGLHSAADHRLFVCRSAVTRPPKVKNHAAAHLFPLPLPSDLFSSTSNFTSTYSTDTARFATLNLTSPTSPAARSRTTKNSSAAHQVLPQSRDN